MRRVRAAAFAMVLANAPACTSHRENTVTVTHSNNGLRLSLPESLAVHGTSQPLTATQTADGFHVAVGADAVRRVAIEASVALRAETPPPPGAWPNTLEIGDRHIHYRIDRSEGGSGGTQIDFHAWEACGGGHLHYTQGDVVEDPGEPEFALVWKVIASTQAPC